MNILETPLEGVFSLESKYFSDKRGSFSRLYCDRELAPTLKNRKIVQVNISKTVKKGSIRGMHFQLPPHAEMKLIRCIKGQIFDVAVDLRKNSKTFLQWYAQVLTPEKNNMLVVPEGCAHGFQTLEANTELLYFHTSHYESEFEGGILFDDPALNIKWPIRYTDISERDKKHPIINDEFSGIKI